MNVKVDAFSMEVYSRLRQLPVKDACQSPLDVVLLIAADVAEDFMRDCPQALEEFIELARKRDAGEIDGE